MTKYKDDDIRNLGKITCKIVADYLGIAPIPVSMGMRRNFFPIGFAGHHAERDRRFSES